MKDTIIQWAIRLIGGFSKAQWSAALVAVSEVATHKILNEERKQWAETQLKRAFPEKDIDGLTQGVINFLIEAALRWLKYKGIIKS